MSKTYPLELLVGQTDAVLDTNFVLDTTILAENRDALYFDTVLDDALGMAANRCWGTLDTSPSSDD